MKTRPRRCACDLFSGKTCGYHQSHPVNVDSGSVRFQLDAANRELDHARAEHDKAQREMRGWRRMQLATEERVRLLRCDLYVAEAREQKAAEDQAWMDEVES